MTSSTSRAILKRRSYGASQDLSRNDLQSERQADAGKRLFSAAGTQALNDLAWCDAGGGGRSRRCVMPSADVAGRCTGKGRPLCGAGACRYAAVFRLLQLNHRFPFVTVTFQG